MKSKAILVSFIAIFAMAFALSTVMAADIIDEDKLDVEVNGISLVLYNVSNAISVEASETIPVLVKFTASENFGTEENPILSLEDVNIEGFKNDVEDETSRFHLVAGNTYVKRLSLTMPNTEDFDDLTEELSLLVRFSAKGEVSQEFFIDLEVQRELHSLNLLSIDMQDVIVSGGRISMDIVVENNGHDRLDNVYIEATIPGLGISRKVYAGDLAPTVDDNDHDINDAVVKRLYLTLPKNAAPGNYEVEVKAYNHDTESIAFGRIVVEGVETRLLSSATSKTISPGQETSFDLVLINPGNSLVVYTILPEETKGILVEVSEPIVAIGGDSSRTVKVNVRATENTQEGTYLVTLNANTESGITKQVSFTLNVEEPSSVTGSSISVGPANNVVILTVVLVIVFVVLLIILIVLLSKRPAELEEAGETNYY